MEVKGIMTNNQFKKYLGTYGIYILIYLFFVYVSYRVPFGGDDWEVATWYNGGMIQTLFGMIRSWLYFNGRVLNNLFDSMLNYYPILWNFVSPIIYVFTIYFIAKIFKFEKHYAAILLFFVMLLTVSDEMRAEIQFHRTVNISYTICICLIYLYIYMMFRNIENEEIKESQELFFKSAIYLVLSMCICLWIENLTLGFLAILAIVTIQLKIEKKKLPLIIKFGWIGGLLGTLIMFSSIVGIQNRINQQMTVLETIQNNYAQLLYYLIGSSINFYLFFLVMSLIAIVSNTIIISNKFIKALYLSSSIILSITIVCINIINTMIKAYFSSPTLYTVISYFAPNSKLMILIEFTILVLLLIAIYYCAERKKFISLYFMAFISSGSVIFQPGARNMLLAQYVVIAFTSYIVYLINIRNNGLKRVVILVLTIMCLFRVELYAYYLEEAKQITEQRTIIIENYKAKMAEGMNMKENNMIITLPKYKEEIFVGNFQSNYYNQSIINYYKLPADTKIVFE